MSLEQAFIVFCEVIASSYQLSELTVETEMLTRYGNPPALSPRLVANVIKLSCTWKQQLLFLRELVVLVPTPAPSYLHHHHHVVSTSQYVTVTRFSVPDWTAQYGHCCVPPRCGWVPLWWLPETFAHQWVHSEVYVTCMGTGLLSFIAVVYSKFLASVLGNSNSWAVLNPSLIPE